MDRVPLRLVELTLAEAPLARSGEQRMARSWQDANRIVAGWSSSMPDERLSCDFKAMFEDGFTYTGTLEFGRGRDGDLVAHVDRLADALLSDDAEREAWRRAVDPDGRMRQHMAAMREHYDLGSAPDAAPGYAPAK